ncbi:hypothetical protein L687_16885 [Microbacterium maritypicum MF109]|uniref:Uncharacterized protein n=1 Tax=Microbacterium maritypicum MF109 TaxID=1333857 RepID=T5KIR0_MICMQ|nr:hypothetical protein L687_16885 [Microbacterium maritypicum MF109]
MRIRFSFTIEVKPSKKATPEEASEREVDMGAYIEGRPQPSYAGFRREEDTYE